MTLCPLVGMGLWGRVCVVFGGRRLWAVKEAEYPRVRVMMRPWPFVHMHSFHVAERKA